MKWQHFLFAFFLMFGLYFESIKTPVRGPASVDSSEAMKAMAESGGF